MLGACVLAALGLPSQARAQPTTYAKVRDLPNPYHLVDGWPTLPKSMNGGHWGEVSRVQIDKAGNFWVFHDASPPSHPVAPSASEPTRTTLRC